MGEAYVPRNDKESVLQNLLSDDYCKNCAFLTTLNTKFVKCLTYNQEFEDLQELKGFYVKIGCTAKTDTIWRQYY